MKGKANRLIESYVEAKDLVLGRGFGAELDWQESVQEKNFSETDLLREGAWVILSSGMNERVVRSKFSAMSRVFLRWCSAEKIVINRLLCKRGALAVFRHERKIKAIIDLADRVHVHGFEAVKGWIIEDGTSYLQSFAYIGPVTCFHLAKNLGISVAKPDRHLSRIASVSGFCSAHDMCLELSDLTGDPISVVDLVLWRFATLESEYREWFAARLG